MRKSARLTQDFDHSIDFFFRVVKVKACPVVSWQAESAHQRLVAMVTSA
jgi:hypothetical protein